MQTLKSRWDVERAAAWLKKHAWGAAGEVQPPPLEQSVVDAVAQDESAEGLDEEIDIAGWPALVAPFYD